MSTPQKKGRRRPRIHGSSNKPRSETIRGSASQRKAVLVLKNFSKIPSKHQDVVRKIITEAFKDLDDVLRIDFSGNFKGEKKYTLTFVFAHTWNRFTKRGYRYWTGPYGMSGEVYVGILKKNNACEDINIEKSCTPLFPDKPEMLGKLIAFVAVHEIGHLLGLMDKSSYSGADDGGHTGDPTNFMFEINVNSEYITKKHERTFKYVIKEGETPKKIAKRRGWGSVEELYNIKGIDGRTNREILENKKLPFTGTEIWLKSIPKSLEFVRRVELTDKSFNREQITTMKQWIKEGKDILQTF